MLRKIGIGFIIAGVVQLILAFILLVREER